MDFIVMKQVLFIIILVNASLCDIKTRIIPDKVHISIILLGLVNINIIPSLLGLILVPLPFLLVAIVQENSMGGGDIKFVGACSFYLGIVGGVVGTCIGLSFAIILHMLYYKYKKGYNSKMALIPCLVVGYWLVNVFSLKNIYM